MHESWNWLIEMHVLREIHESLKMVKNHVKLKVGDEWIVVNSATQSFVRTKRRNGWYKSTKPWEYRYPLIWSMKLSESWIHLCFFSWTMKDGYEWNPGWNWLRMHKSKNEYMKLSWNMKNCVASMNESWWIIVKDGYMNSKLMNPSWKMVIWTKNDENQEMYPRFEWNARNVEACWTWKQS